MQAEGMSAKISHKAAAYASITSSSYNGPWKGFTFSSYVTLHQAAHNELLDLDEPVSETKKVTDFLKGIRDPNLNTGKSIVLGDPTKLKDFKKCQQYLSTIIRNLGNQAKAEQHIVAVHTGGGGGGSLVDKIKGGSYTDEQFQSLSLEEKKRVLMFCEEAKKKKSWKQKVQKKRRAARLKSEWEGGDEPTEEMTEVNAGAQFGGNGNQKKQKS
jgi:hypothetical protein